MAKLNIMTQKRKEEEQKYDSETHQNINAKQGEDTRVEVKRPKKGN